MLSTDDRLRLTPSVVKNRPSQQVAKLVAETSEKAPISATRKTNQVLVRQCEARVLPSFECVDWRAR